MRHVLTAAEMAAADQRTEGEYGIPLVNLMERAGMSVARFCLREYAELDRVTVLCGKGNNGGDGLVAARVMAQAGVETTVLLLAVEAEVTGLAAVALCKLEEAKGAESSLKLRVEFCEDVSALSAHAAALEEAELLVDAIVGTGFKAPLRGVAAVLQEWVGRLLVPVVSVDLPSGWDADSREPHAEGAFRADAVVTFTAPKQAHVFGHMACSRDSGAAFGPVVVAEIGSPAEAVRSVEQIGWTGGSKLLAEKPRDVNGNKGKYGHVLIVGGSYGTFGAPSMSALAALRTGAGLVTAGVPRSIVNEVGRVAPELMVRALAEEQGAASLATLEPAALAELMKGITVLALGPGLSTRAEAGTFATALIEKTTLPVVIDADGLNAFAGRTELLRGAALLGGPDGGRRTVVLTPHPGEMARLLGVSVREVEADRFALARTFALHHQVMLVLKGWRTLVAHPDGRVAVNTTGNPAMAKGGSGDILTGIVAAMLAQYPEDVARAVETAVFLHGLAGDCAAHSMDEHTVLATDTVGHLSDAFRYRVRDEDGFTWICGVHA